MDLYRRVGVTVAVDLDSRDPPEAVEPCLAVLPIHGLQLGVSAQPASSSSLTRRMLLENLWNLENMSLVLHPDNANHTGLDPELVNANR